MSPTESQSTKSYPRLPDKVWWGLRKQFTRAVPATVTPSYLASVLSVTESTARQVLSNLQSLQLVDEAGKPTSLANDWRHDQTYAAACSQMLTAVYPQELLDIASPPDVDRATVQDWLMRKLMTGAEAARQMAALYVLIAQGDPNAEGKTASTAAGGARRTVGAKPAARSSSGSARVRRTEPDAGAFKLALPTPQIAVQVNIDPAMTPEQIETIFASMARHLYGIAD